MNQMVTSDFKMPAQNLFAGTQKNLNHDDCLSEKYLRHLEA
jgi:hypothetical protein